MKKFTNENIQKERKKKIRNLIISILLIVIAVLCKYWEQQEIDKANKNIQDLNSIILSKEDKTDKKAYIDAKNIPYKFAVYDDTTDSYYIISDGQYLYIAYMSTFDFNRLNTETISEKPIRIEGITKETTKDIKELAVNAYNRSMQNEEDKITLADFENYFGSVYLNMTMDDSQVAFLPFMLFFLLMLFGIIFLIAYLIEWIKYNRSIKKLDDYQISTIDQEVNASSAFYYEKAHLYLTEHYIINFSGALTALRYEDILWMYPFIQRTNGIKTSQSIKVLANDGKTYTIAVMDIVTKAKKEAYDEIWNTIIQKNPNIVTGYTKENIKAMKEKVKEIKKK